MSPYKVVSKNALSGLQVKKSVYKSKTDFLKYSPDLIKRWSKYHNVEIYILTDSEEWVMLDSYSSKCNLDCEGCWLNIPQRKKCRG